MDNRSADHTDNHELFYNRSNIKNRAKKLYLHKKNGLQYLLREVVSNAIQSKKTGESVEVDIQIEFAKDNQEKELEAVNISIKDNGDGFTKENCECFKMLDKENESKKQLLYNPQGQGRLSIVYFTNSAKYTTVFNEEDEFFKREFDYPLEEGVWRGAIDRKKKVEEKETYTILNLEINGKEELKRANKFFDKYDSIEKLQEWFIEEFFSYLVEEKAEINLCYLKEKKEIKINEECIKFEYSECDFSIWIVNTELGENKKNDTKIRPCSRGLTCKFESTYKLEYELNVPFRFFITSDFFNDRVSETGEVINIEKKDFDSIQEEVTSALSNEFRSIIDENREKTKSNIKKIRSKYIMHSKFIDDDDVIHSSLNEIIEKDLKKIMIDTKSNEEIKFLDGEDGKYNKVINSAIYLYMTHRKRIYEKYSKYIEDYRNSEGNKKNVLESDMHELICPSGEYTRSIDDYQKHNLWLIDDKFAYFQHTKSAKNGEKGVDILIFSDENERPIDVLFVELKRPNQAHNAGEMTKQVVDYAEDYIKKGKGTGKNGGDISIEMNDCRFHGIIIASKDDIIEEIDKKYMYGRYKVIPFLKNTYYDDFQMKDESKIPKIIRIEMFSFEDLKTLAEKRNQIFFKLLKEELEWNT